MSPSLVNLSLKALRDWDWDVLVDWLSVHGSRIGVVIALAVGVNLLFRRAVPPAIRAGVLRDATPQNEIDLRKRADTLAAVIIHTAEFGLLTVGALLVLSELGFKLAPLLTGLGIGGLALGLGAQSLVRDMINGIFILVENQYGRGDLISVAGVQGWVEEVNLRRTVIRDADGTVFSIPNGEVKVSGNLTRGYSGINLLVPVAGASDLDRAMVLIDEVGQDIAADPELGPLVVDAPKAARVETLSGTGLTIRVLGKAVPGSQFEVAGALRRRLKQRFDTAEIRFGDPVPAPPSPPAPAAAAPGPPPRPPG
jgi:moderate conductance mechanosensitive channel